MPSLPMLANASRFLVAIAYGSFVVLALPKSAFGVAWPSASVDFDQSLGMLGLALVIHTAGYMTAGAASGAAAERFGAGSSLLIGSLVSTAGLAGYAALPWWAAFLGSAFVLGMGGGLMDAVLNAHVATRHRARVMNLLHASFGVGATAGPMLMTVLLAAGGSWRAGYASLAIIQLALTIVLWLVRSRWEEPKARRARIAPRPPATRRQKRALGVGLVVFLLYAGLEVAAGQWAFSLLTEARSMGPTVAGLTVTVYWASFTVGRFLAGIVDDRLAPQTLVRGASGFAMLATAGFWWSPAPVADIVSLVLLGLSLAGIFPALMLLTPSRVGLELTGRAVGYQLAAASIGIAVIPGGAGLLVSRFGLESIPPLLVVTAAGMWALSEAALRTPLEPVAEVA